MKHRFMVNPILCTVSGAVCLAFVLMGGIMLFSLQRLVSALIFFAFGVLFLGVAIHFGTILTIDREGITRSVLGIQRKYLPWKKVKEVGVAGTRVVKDPKSKHVGTLYIYFSEETLDKDSRFRYILSWPHWNHCYLLFSHKRVTAVQMIWDRKIETFNVGDLTLGEGLKN
ncbi:MAG: hypothetical protein IKG91_03550 [Firmicutes bacterium]|nr:hypothetical protein [Bacillota bacterium]